MNPDVSWALLLLHDISSFAIRIVMICLVPRWHSPPTAMAWLLVIFLWPWPGLIFYLVFNSHKLPRERVLRHENMLNRLDRKKAACTRGERPEPVRLFFPLDRFAALGEKLGDMPAVSGNTMELLDSAENLAARLAADIDGARHHVHLLYYIASDDSVTSPVFSALARAASRGVSCKLLVDSLGSKQFLASRAGELEKQGIEITRALPLHLLRRGPLTARFDLRNHRKLAVVDGRLGYMGSHNLTDPSYGGKAHGLLWKDLTMRTEGPLALQLQRVFLEDWYVETGDFLDEGAGSPLFSHHGEHIIQTVPSGPSYATENYQRLVVSALHCAKSEVIITTPYLIPDEGLQEGLEIATLNGARVRMVIPRRSDQFIVGNAARAYYEPLMDKGVEIYLYEEGILHAKTMTVDGNLAFFGSSNFDIRSFALNFELNCVLYGKDSTSPIRQAQERFLKVSRQLSPEKWGERSFTIKTVEGVTKLFSPLL